MAKEIYEGDIDFPAHSIGNVAYIGDPQHGYARTYIPIKVIAKNLAELTGGWPKRVGPRLFLDEGEKGLRYLPDASHLFSWLKEHFSVCWDDESVHPVTLHPCTPVTPTEFLNHLAHTVDPYLCLETLPHMPLIEDPPIYYLGCRLPKSTGNDLADFLKNMNPETERDRHLICAAAVTPGWGGPSGCRPAFIMASKHGYGVGKTETAKLISSLWGGAVEINERDGWDKIQKAVMNDAIIGRRCLLIDNLKGHLSHSGLESLITASDVGGHVMYEGYQKRPNFLTIFITANVPSLSRDLTDRCITIQIGKKQHQASWKEWALYFYRERRLHFISDCLAFLKAEPRCILEPRLLDRWATWEKAVLSRFAQGNEILRHVHAVRHDLDNELMVAESITCTIKNLIVAKGHENPDAVCIRLSKLELASALAQTGITGFWKDMSPGDVTGRINTAKGHQHLHQLREDGDAWIWTGPEYSTEEKPSTGGEE